MADIWLIGGAITSGSFDSAAQEASADALEARGHTVTRVNGNLLTDAPLTSDCDVVIHLDSTVDGEFALRATATGAAPIISCNSYYVGNSFGAVAMLSGAAGTDASDDEWQILNLSPGWTDGYSINDIVTVAGFAVYQERLWSAVAGGLAFARTPAANHNVVWGFDAGTTNLAGATTTARIVCCSLFAGLQHLNTAGAQIFDDLIVWAIGEPPDQTLAASGFDASPTFGAVAVDSTVTLAPSGFDASPSFGTPTLDSESVISPAGFDASPSFGTPVMVGDQQLEVGGFDASPTFGTPGFVYDQPLAPSGFDASPTFGDITLDSTVTLAPSGFDASPTFGVPRPFIPAPIGWQVFVRARDNLTGTPDAQLFNVTNLKGLVPLNGVGTGQLTIPLHAPDLAAEWELILEDDAIIDVHHDGARRYRMRVDDIDLIELDGTQGELAVTLSGPTFGGELDEIVVLPDGYPVGQGSVRDTTGSGMHAWAVMIGDALDAGGGQLLTVGFGANDSTFTPWPADTHVAARLQVGTTLLQAVQALQVPGKADWWIDGDGVLQAVPQKGTDRSGQVVLRVGAHQLVRRRRLTRRRIVNQALVMGPDGTIEAVDDDDSVALHGGRMSVIRAGTDDTDDRQALGTAVVEARAEAVTGVEVQVPAFALGARLWSDWDLGDTIAVDIEGVLGAATREVARVQAIVFETDMVETTVEVTLGTADEVAEEVFEARFAQVVNGQQLGLQQAAGSVASQLGVEVGGLEGINPTSLSVVNRGGAAVNESAIQVSWTAPSGAGSESVVGYEVALADPGVFAFGLARDRRRTSTTNLAVFGLIPNTEYVVTVFSLNVLGERIGSVEATYTTPLDSTAPSQVTGLSVIGDVGQLRAVWSAVSDTDVANSRGDYQVQVSTSSGFGSTVIDARTASTIASLPGLTTGVTYYVRVRAIDSSGNVGTWSSTANAGPRVVTGSDIGSGTVTGGNIGGGTVTGSNIGSGTVTGSNVGSGTLTGGNLAGGTVTGGNIGGGTITGSNVGSGTLTGGNLAGGTVTGSNIAAGTITAGNIQAGTITTTQIAAGTIQAGDIAAGTITATQLAANSVTATQIAAGAITASDITSGTMSADRINGGAISGVSINIGGGAFTVSSGGAVTASSYALTGGTITSPAISGATIIGGTINIGSGAFTVNGSGQVTLGATSQVSWAGNHSYILGTSGVNRLHLYAGGELRLQGGSAVNIYGTTTVTGSLVAGTIASSGFPGTIASAGALHVGDDNAGSYTANANINTANGRIRRDTSSIRFKDNVRARSGSDRATARTGVGADTAEVKRAKAVLSLDPIWYTPQVTDRPGDWSGFVAEDAHDLGLRHLVAYDDEECTVPGYFDYARLGVDHHIVLQHHEDRIDALEAALGLR